MIKSIKINHLKVGMYVILPGSWFKHSLMKTRFLITSQKQIENIIENNIDIVDIDTSKGEDLEKSKNNLPVNKEVIKEVESISHATPPPIDLPSHWNPEKNIDRELKEAVENNKLPPEKKAKAVYDSSLKLMRRVFDQTSKESIVHAKKGIYKIVDLILSEEETAAYLFKITSHDFYTYTHSVNVGVLSISLSQKLYKGVTDHDMHELGAGFFLHDLGKTKVDPAIINKPGKLTEAEMCKMRIHPYQSYKLLKETGQLSEEARIIAMQHHERENGTGYPRNLKGDEIHEYGRICCIADVFDALTAERSYKRSLSPFEALKIMKNEMLGHFHKEIFTNFVQLFN